MARKPTVRIEVHLSGTLRERIPEPDIPDVNDDEGWERFKWTMRQIVRDAIYTRDEQLAIREARSTYK